MLTDKKSIETPAFLLDLDILECSLKKYQQMADSKGKKLWPMIKTHKSTEIARMQLDYGASGFLCGTLDECEAVFKTIVRSGRKDIGIMYAYPVAGYPNISRVVKLAGDCDGFCLRIDNYVQAVLLNEAASEAGVCVNYTVIINSGLNRFGVVPCCGLESLMNEISDFKHLKFAGISTHPGQVYQAADSEGILKAARQESGTMNDAVRTLHKMGIKPQFVSSGSTPTFPHIINDTVINILHPGNYIFMDNIQISLGCAEEKDCALTVLATVISAPRDGEFIIDAGSKCLGLDKGAHGNGKIKGHGRIKDQERFILDNNTAKDENVFLIYSLSEEVGKIAVQEVNRDKVNIKIGDVLEIIPNHSCAAANNTSYYIALRKGIFDRLIHVDMRGNSTAKRMAK